MIDFQFHHPASLDEALELLDRYGEDARLMAGGTALVLQMKQRFAQPEHVIGLRGLARNDGLGGLEESEASIRIGALCTLRRMEDSPLLRQRIPMLAGAISRVATRRIRSMATLGGALVNGDPNQDPPPALIALNATVEFTSSAGTRNCPVEDIFIDYYETDVRPGEVLTAVRVPVPAEDTCAAYLKFLPRTADDYATVSVAAVVSRNADNTCRDARIVLGGRGSDAGSRPRRRGCAARAGAYRGCHPRRCRNRARCRRPSRRLPRLSRLQAGNGRGVRSPRIGAGPLNYSLSPWERVRVRALRNEAAKHLRRAGRSP